MEQTACDHRSLEQSRISADDVGASWARSITNSVSAAIRSADALTSFTPEWTLTASAAIMVVAPANGIVIKADWQGGYGNMIEIDHGNGLTTRYGHLSKIEIQVGDMVQRGQLIGMVGSTGRSTGPHLHYELRLNDKAINPRRFLPPEPSEIKKAAN